MSLDDKDGWHALHQAVKDAKEERVIWFRDKVQPLLICEEFHTNSFDIKSDKGVSYKYYPGSKTLINSVSKKKMCVHPMSLLKVINKVKKSV